MCTYVHRGAGMRIRNSDDLGNYVREQRREAGLTQADLAAQARVSRRWLSDLEGGKSTAEVGRVFKVIAALDMVVDLQPIPHQDIDLDELLDNLGGGG
jgi:HTH-type transcriptional regulator/antitoxin HipB